MTRGVWIRYFWNPEKEWRLFWGQLGIKIMLPSSPTPSRWHLKLRRHLKLRLNWVTCRFIRNVLNVKNLVLDHFNSLQNAVLTCNRYFQCAFTNPVTMLEHKNRILFPWSSPVAMEMGLKCILLSGEEINVPWVKKNPHQIQFKLKIF